MRKAPFALLLLVATACATNPVTHKKEFNLVSESQEIQLGQQSDVEVLKQFGVYGEKPALNQLVDNVGHRLAAVSDRPNLPWHFTIIDTPMVNAMALPGGYVYITRGMMERINSEDELAGVLGHEITHVTARHAAQQMSRAEVAQLGFVIGAVVAPGVTQSFGQLAELGVGLLFQRYSRAQESQADLVGTEYVTRANYNPTGVEKMLTTLMRLDKHPAQGIDKYFMSHPDPAKRVRDVDSELKKIVAQNPGATAKQPDRNAYLRLVDGIMTGDSTQRVVIQGNTIFDRAHGLILQAPAGWVPTASEGMLFTMTPRGQNQSAALLAQEVDDKDLGGYNAQNGVRARLQQMGLQFLGSRNASMRSGQQFTIDVWTGQTQNGQIGVESTEFPHGDHVAVLMFLTPQVNQYQSPLGEILSRAEINPQRAASAQPARIRVEPARNGDTWREIARRATGDITDAEAIANMNGYDVSEQPAAGVLVKLPSDVAKD